MKLLKEDCCEIENTPLSLRFLRHIVDELDLGTAQICCKFYVVVSENDIKYAARFSTCYSIGAIMCNCFHKIVCIEKSEQGPLDIH